MNETVRGMVEKLFENTVMNEETKALMDEVMNNCQERFEDLAEKGLPEEEILAAAEELAGLNFIARLGSHYISLALPTEKTS